MAILQKCRRCENRKCGSHSLDQFCKQICAAGQSALTEKLYCLKLYGRSAPSKQKGDGRKTNKRGKRRCAKHGDPCRHLKTTQQDRGCSSRRKGDAPAQQIDDDPEENHKGADGQKGRKPICNSVQKRGYKGRFF